MAHGDVEIDIRGNNKQLKQSLAGSLLAIKRFGSRVTRIFVGVGLVILARKFFSLSKVIFRMYRDQEAAEARLTQVVKATGAAAGFSADEFKILATRYQDMSGVADDLILNMFTVLSTFRQVRGDHFKEASVAILDMAEALQLDLKSAALQVGKALNDPIAGMSALRRSGVSFTNAQVEMVKVLMETGNIFEAQKIILAELKQEFGGTASAVTSASKGFQKLTNRLGDAGEVIVDALLPAFELALELFEQFVIAVENIGDALNDNKDAIKDYVATLRTKLISTYEYATDVLLLYVATTQEVWSTISAVVSMAVASVILGLVSLGGWFKHILTVVVPTYVKWFVDNTVNMFSDMANGIKAILTNAGKNIKMFFEDIADLLKGGSGKKWEWVGLMEGFETSMKKLPEIAKRELSDFEKSLISQMKDLEDRLDSGTFDERVTKRYLDMIEALKFLREEREALPPEPEGNANRPFADPVPRKKKKGSKDDKGDLNDDDGTFERIFKAAAGRGGADSDPVIQTMRKQHGQRRAWRKEADKEMRARRVEDLRARQKEDKKHKEDRDRMIAALDTGVKTQTAANSLLDKISKKKFYGGVA